jgi:large subunit ribosomal protein L25
MANVKLEAKNREIVGKKVKRLRADGWIPAVLFGAEQASTPVQVEERELDRTLREAGSTALIDLHLDEESKPHIVLVRDIQRDVLTSRLQHVDFYQVQLDRKVKTSPSLHIVGEAPIVETTAGVLVQILNQVEVECLPTDLIDAIEVDVSSLESLEDSITIGDLQVPPGVTILADPADPVVSVVVPRAAFLDEEEEAAAEEALLAELGVEEMAPGEAELEAAEPVSEESGEA